MRSKEYSPKAPGDLRRKAAAWTVGLSLFGGVAVESANADSSTVHNQASANLIAHGEQAGESAQSFINTFDSKLAGLVAKMPSSSYFSKWPDKPLSKAWGADVTIEYVGVPSKTYPGRYDWLAVTMKEGEAIPLTATIELGADSKKFSQIKDYKFSYLFGQVNNVGNIMPHSMAIATSEGMGAGDTSTYFEISSEGYPSPLLPEGGVRYSKDSSRVSAQFNAFLNQTQRIVTRH